MSSVLEIDGAEIDPSNLVWREVFKRPKQVEAVEIPAPFTVETEEGTMEAEAGDMLIRGVDGEYYPCKKSVFEQSYLSGDDIVPEYSEQDLKRAQRQFNQNTLEFVPVHVVGTDARQGVREFLKILRGEQ